MEGTHRCTAAVGVQRRGGVARLIINRPPLNILDIAAIRELRQALEAVMPDAQLIEMRGAGEQAFCAGVEIRDHFPERAPEMLAEFHALVRTILYAPVPVVAAVRGHCLGGGMELVLASDLAVATEDACFGQPEIRVGCFAPLASVLLPKAIPEKRALEILLTGRSLGAAEAERFGLVNAVASPERFEEQLERFESCLLAQSQGVLAIARKAARWGTRGEWEAALRESERLYLEELLRLPDAVEGLHAFLEKRPPVWDSKGRSGADV